MLAYSHVVRTFLQVAIMGYNEHLAPNQKPWKIIKTWQYFSGFYIDCCLGRPTSFFHIPEMSATSPPLLVELVNGRNRGRTSSINWPLFFCSFFFFLGRMEITSATGARPTFLSNSRLVGSGQLFALMGCICGHFAPFCSKQVGRSLLAAAL